MAKPIAKIILCPGITNEGEFAHDMRDRCSSCEPFWREIPICVNGHKLTDTYYCKRCRKHYAAA